MLSAAFLAVRNARTLEEYARDLDDFRRFAGEATSAEAAERLHSDHGYG